MPDLERPRSLADNRRVSGVIPDRTDRRNAMSHRFGSVHYIRRLSVLLAGLAVALTTSSIAVPAAFARILPPTGAQGSPAQTPSPQAHLMVSGGMPGWEITLIAVGAALVAAVVAVILDHSMVLRRHATRAAS
jgi:hypothetical protein